MWAPGWSVCLAPPTGRRAHTGRCDVPPDLVIAQQQGGPRIDVEADAQCVPDSRVLNGQFPGQEHQAPVLAGWEASSIKARATSLDHGMRLTGIKNHHRSLAQGNALTCLRKLQVQPLVLAQEEIAKSRSAKYHMWTDVDGKAGLLRQNSVLRASKGIREETEEELLPKAFELDCGRVSMALQSLERFRLKIIDWVHPDGPA